MTPPAATRRTAAKQRVLDLLAERGTVRMKDLLAEGVRPGTVRHLVGTGAIASPARGVYSSWDSWSDQTDTVAAAVRTPRAVVCLVSAASVHGLVTAPPSHVWLAIPRRAWRPAVKDGAPPTVVVPMPAELVAADALPDGTANGVVERDFGGGQRARITTPARTVADLFRWAGVGLRMPDGSTRAAIPTSLAVEALQSARDNGEDVGDILRLAGAVGSRAQVEAALAATQAMRW